MKTKLGSLGDIFIGLTYKPEDVSEQGVIVLRSGNIQDGNLVFDDIVRVSKDVSDRFFVKENDILMCSRNGSARLVGKSVLITHLNEQMSLGAFMTIIRTPYNSYLKHFFDSEAFRRQLGSSATSTINQITKNMLDNIEVDLPEKNDMDSIVCILDKINQIISKQKTQLSKFDELIKSRFIEMFGDIHEPSKWEKKPWSELVIIQNGRDYKNILVESGGYPVYGTGGEMARASEYLCSENTVIIGRKGTINNPLLVKEKFWNVDTAFGVIVGNQLHYQYFYNFCRLFDFSTLNKQAVLPSTTKADLLKIEIAVPPMELQTQFAAFVEQTDKSGFETIQYIFYATTSRCSDLP